MADADTKHDELEPHDGDSTGTNAEGHHAAHEHEHDTDEEGAAIDSAAFASLEALESGEDAPILPVRAIDDEETDGAEASTDDSDNTEDESDEESDEESDDESSDSSDDDSAEESEDSEGS